MLLANSDSATTRSIIYSDRPDPYLIHEARALGAFFERADRLANSLVGYVRFGLPERDRRESTRFDRRAAFRGGRRCVDVAVAR